LTGILQHLASREACRLTVRLPVAMMAIGYKGDGSGLSNELRKRDEVRRPRKSLQEFVFKNEFNGRTFLK